MVADVSSEWQVVILCSAIELVSLAFVFGKFVGSSLQGLDKRIGDSFTEGFAHGFTECLTEVFAENYAECFVESCKEQFTECFAGGVAKSCVFHRRFRGMFRGRRRGRRRGKVRGGHRTMLRGRLQRGEDVQDASA